MENKIGTRIRERREQLGMTQVQLEKKTGIDHSTICSWEKGRHEPTVFFAICVARALNTTVEELFGP